MRVNSQNKKIHYKPFLWEFKKYHTDILTKVHKQLDYKYKSKGPCIHVIQTCRKGKEGNYLQCVTTSTKVLHVVNFSSMC